MRDRYVKDIAGVDSTGPWLAADGRYCPSFSLVCGPVVTQLENRIAAHCRRAAPDVACVCAILFDAPCHASRRPNVCIRAHGAGLRPLPSVARHDPSRHLLDGDSNPCLSPRPFSSFCGSRPQLRRLIRTLGPLNARSLSPNEHASRPPAGPGQLTIWFWFSQPCLHTQTTLHNDAVCVRQQPLTLYSPRLGRRFLQRP